MQDVHRVLRARGQPSLLHGSFFFCTLKSCKPVSSLDCSGQAASQSFFVKSSVQYSIDYADSFTAARDIHERIYCKCNGFGYKQCVRASCKACNNYYMVLETAEKSIIVTERLADGSLFFGCFPFHLMFWVTLAASRSHCWLFVKPPEYTRHT